MATIGKRSWTSGGETRTAWRASFTDQHGRRRTRQFARKKDAAAFLVTASAEVARGVHLPDSVAPTVADAAAKWLSRCEARGLGVGTVLTETALAWAHEQGYVTCVTDWRSANLLAARFWPRQGFRPTAYRLYRSIRLTPRDRHLRSAPA